MTRTVAALAAAALTLTAATAAQASITRATWRLPTQATGCYQRGQPDRCLLRWWVRHTWHAQDARQVARSPFGRADLSGSIPYERWAKGIWKARYRSVLRTPIPTAGTPTGAILAGLMCIHRGEGAMTSVNPAGPYYGGWQMDASFEATYGPEFTRAYGTADHWPAHDQLIAAYRGYLARGWSPWPVTSRRCGL